MNKTKFEKLIKQILERNPNLTKEDLLLLVERKKKEIGSGYLTDMGALFLVASELDVELKDAKEVRLKEIRDGLSGIDVIAYFLTASPTKEYRDKTGKTGRYRTLYVFEENITRVILWNNASLYIDKLNPKPGEKLLLKNCSVKRGRSGSLELHLDEKGEITLLDDPNKEGLKYLDKITKEIRDITQEEMLTVVKGSVTSDIKVVSYTNKEGKQSKALSFYLTDIKDHTKRLRVIIWNIKDESMKNLIKGKQIRIVGLIPKRNKYNILELHGEEEVINIELLKDISLDSSIKNYVLLSLGRKIEENDEVKIKGLLIDPNTLHTHIATFYGKSIINKITNCNPGDILRLKMNNVNMERGKLFVKNGLVDIVRREGKEILDKFSLKIMEIKGKSFVILEALTLSKCKIEEIRTRKGSIVKKATVLIGDDTGEAKITAWGDLTILLENVMPGERVVIYGGVAQFLPYLEERIIEIKDFTQIKKI